MRTIDTRPPIVVARTSHAYRIRQGIARRYSQSAMPPPGHPYFNAYEFAAEVPLHDDIRERLQERKPHHARRAIAWLLVAVIPAAIGITAVIVGIHAGPATDVLSCGAFAIIGLGLLIASYHAAIHANIHRRLHANTLWRFEILQAYREEIEAQRAIGRLKRNEEIAETLWLFQEPLGIARIDDCVITRSPRISLTRKSRPLTQSLDGVIYRNRADTQ